MITSVLPLVIEGDTGRWQTSAAARPGAAAGWVATSDSGRSGPTENSQAERRVCRLGKLRTLFVCVLGLFLFSRPVADDRAPGGEPGRTEGIRRTPRLHYCRTLPAARCCSTRGSTASGGISAGDLDAKG